MFSSPGFGLSWPLFGLRTHVVEPNQIDVLAFTVLCDLEQIDDAKEPRFARQCRSNIRKTDRRDRIDYDFTFFHTVSVARFDVGPQPYSDTASDLSPANSFAEPFGKHHTETLHACKRIHSICDIFLTHFKALNPTVTTPPQVRLLPS